MRRGLTARIDRAAEQLRRLRQPDPDWVRRLTDQQLDEQIELIRKVIAGDPQALDDYNAACRAAGVPPLAP